MAEPKLIESGVLTLVLTKDISMHKCPVSRGSCQDFSFFFFFFTETNGNEKSTRTPGLVNLISNQHNIQYQRSISLWQRGNAPLSFPAGKPAGVQNCLTALVSALDPTSLLVPPANGWAQWWGYSAGSSCLTQAASSRQPLSSGTPVGFFYWILLSVFLFTGVQLAW